MTDKKHKAPELAFTPVKSWQIKDVHYDATGKTLHVRFHSGGHYSYAGVEKKIADGLTTAESVGKYFGQHIKPLKFTSARQEGRRVKVASIDVPSVSLVSLVMDVGYRSPDRLPAGRNAVPPTVEQQQALRRAAKSGQCANVAELARVSGVSANYVNRFVEF